LTEIFDRNETRRHKYNSLSSFKFRLLQGANLFNAETKLVHRDLCKAQSSYLPNDISWLQCDFCLGVDRAVKQFYPNQRVRGHNKVLRSHLDVYRRVPGSTFGSQWLHGTGPGAAPLDTGCRMWMLISLTLHRCALNRHVRHCDVAL
jgi:hypothetical protein